MKKAKGIEIFSLNTCIHLLYSNRLIPTAQYYPLRFHIIRALTSLADSTKVFIPLAPYIFEVFESAEIKKKGKAASLKPMEWDVYIRAPKQFLHTKVYQVCKSIHGGGIPVV
jgi:Noc2p family